MFSRYFTEVNDLRFQKSLHLGVDHIKMYSLSGQGAEEPTVYGWNTKVSAPFNYVSVVGKNVNTNNS